MGGMEPAMFSVDALFGGSSSEEDEERDAEEGRAKEEKEEEEEYVERAHEFPGGQAILVREFSFHVHNANLLWPGAISFAHWLWARPLLLAGRRVLEIGSGTGALAIFLHKAMGCDISTSDYADPDGCIQRNIAHNCTANGIAPLPHIPHTWGEPFPVPNPGCIWDCIIASDILLYVRQYANLITTLKALLTPRARPQQQEQVQEGNGCVGGLGSACCGSTSAWGADGRGDRGEGRSRVGVGQKCGREGWGGAVDAACAHSEEGRGQAGTEAVGRGRDARQGEKDFAGMSACRQTSSVGGEGKVEGEGGSERQEQMSPKAPQRHGVALRRGMERHTQQQECACGGGEVGKQTPLLLLPPDPSTRRAHSHARRATQCPPISALHAQGHCKLPPELQGSGAECRVMLGEA